jgi:hypothetical protein
MTGSENCPDCGARLPAGLCPLCLLRPAADLAVGSGWGASTDDHGPADGEAEAFPTPAAMSTEDGAIGAVARIHLRDTTDRARLVRPGSPEIPDLWRRIDAVRAKAAALAVQGQGASKDP